MKTRAYERDGIHCILRSRKTPVLTAKCRWVYMYMVFISNSCLPYTNTQIAHIEPCVLGTAIVRQTKSKICIACRAQKLNCTYFDLLPKWKLSSIFKYIFGHFAQCKNSDNKIAVKLRQVALQLRTKIQQKQIQCTVYYLCISAMYI